MTIEGLYNNGQQLIGTPVSVEFEASDDVVIQGDGIQLRVALTALGVSDRLGNIPRFLYLPGGGVIETHANDAIDAALASRRRGRLAGAVHFLERHRGIAAGATLMVILITAFTVYFGLPRLARRVAHAVPPSIERQAGQAALLAIRQRTGPTQLDWIAQNRVRRQLTRLLKDRPQSEYPKVEFVSMGGQLPNAFALPGNIIVVSDEFVRLAGSEDEIAAVMAHELGHLEARHGMQSVLRGSLALLVVTSLTGDLATLTSFTTALPFVLLQKGYSREFEREADRHALQLMTTRGIPSGSFVTILRKLESTRPKQGADLTYLSTHPSTDERAALFASQDAVATDTPTTSPALSDAAPAPAPSAGVEAPIETAPAGAVSPARGTRDALPRPISQAQPKYPFALHAANIAGEVVVSFVVDEEGNTRDVRAIRSTHSGFEGAAVECVQQWTFHPAIRAGQPAPTRMQVPIVFSLNGTPDAPK